MRAVQKLLGHSSIQTTTDTYADWDIEQLAETMRDVLAQDESMNRSPRLWTKGPQSGPFMEAAGIEPASAAAPD